MNYTDFQAMLTRRLLSWSVFSVFVGLAMRTRGKFWKSVGLQFIVWGMIDGVIAIVGQSFSGKRLKNVPPDVDLRDAIWRDKQVLKVILGLNAILDVFYVLGGIRWIRRNPEDKSKSGHGWGVIIQGLFLFFFDLFHTVKLIQSVEPLGED